MDRINWGNTNFVEDVLSCLPEIGKAIQLTSFFRPPDSDPNDFAYSIFDYFPYKCDDAEWQVKLSLLPLFEKWFNKIKGISYPNSFTEDELEEKWNSNELKQWDILNYQIHSSFSISIYISTLCQIIPYSKTLLYMLLDRSWGEVINTAACVALLSIGEKEVPFQNIKFIFGIPLANLEREWKNTYYSRDFKQHRIYDPNSLPISVWKQVFSTLRETITENDELLFSMLAYAQETGGLLGREISKFALDVGLLKPLPLTILLNSEGPSKDDIRYFQMAFNNLEFCSTYPEFIKRLESSMHWYKAK